MCPLTTNAHLGYIANRRTARHDAIDSWLLWDKAGNVNWQSLFQWCKQDQNVNTKTNWSRPAKQQQEYITEKTLLLQHTSCLLSKNNLVQKRQKSDVWLCFSRYCTEEHRCLLYFSIIVSHSVLSGTHSVGNKTKSIRPRLRPRPRPVWDRSCHKTAVSDPKTALFHHKSQHQKVKEVLTK